MINSSETLSGVTTVRAMAAVPRFVRENEELVEASLRTTYSGQVLKMMMMIQMIILMMRIWQLKVSLLDNFPYDGDASPFLFQAASQWLELRLQLLGCAVVAGVAIIAVNKITCLKVILSEMMNKHLGSHE